MRPLEILISILPVIYLLWPLSGKKDPLIVGPLPIFVSIVLILPFMLPVSD